MYLFAKAKEEIGLDVAIEYQGKVLAGNSLVVSGQEYTRYDMKLIAAEDCHEQDSLLFPAKKAERFCWDLFH